MKLKFSFIAVLAALAGLAACNKEYDVPAGRTASGLCSISVGIKGAGVTTRSAGTAAENAYDNAKILAFNSNNVLTDYKTWNGSNVKFTLPADNYTFCAVLNFDENDVPGFISDLDDFDDTVAKLTGMTGTAARRRFTMTGRETGVTVNSDSPAGVVQIHVQRLVARIVLKKITRDMVTSSNQEKTFHFVKAYAINVVGDEPYENRGAYEPEEWLNKMGYTASAADGLLCIPGNVDIDDGDVWQPSGDAVIYVLPNYTTDDSHAGAWSPRKTRIVIEGTLGGETCYYPITFNEIDGNTCYTIANVTLTKEGSDHPDVPVVADDACQATIIIDPWTDEDAIEVENSTIL